jgi:D-alanine transaminase
VFGAETTTVFLDGRFCPLSEAAVSVTDRGFLFGDGIYEVYRVYQGRPFRRKEHLDRLRRSAAEVRLALPELDWAALQAELVARNGLDQADATVYIQVTRGAPAARRHAFPPAGTPPTLLVMARRFVAPSADLYERGVAAITRPDIRWGRCDIKSVNLLPNVMANEDAHAAGAWEAIFVRDGVVTEGTHTNVFLVLDGRLVTHPEGPRILSGVSRAVVIEAARSIELEVAEAPCLANAMARATEVLLSGTTAEVLPVVHVDGRPVGDGRPGPIARRLLQAFRALTDAA